MGREWRYAADKTTGKLGDGGMSSAEYPFVPTINEASQRLRVYVADPDQQNEAQPDPYTQKDDVSVADGDLGALLDRPEQEIADEATAAQLHSLDYINDLPASDQLRLQMRGMWCIAKKSGEVAEDTSFPDFLAWVAADQED